MAESDITRATIVNWALVELGQPPNFTIDDQTGLGALVDIFFPRAEARCLGLTDWTFARRTYRLTRQAEEPVTGYRYGYDLPGGRIGEPMKTLFDPRSEQPLRDKRIEGNTLFADEEQAYAVCKMRLEPSAWDLQYADCFAVALAGLLAIPILQDADMAAEKAASAFGTPSQGGAGGMFGRLIAQNRAASPVASPLFRNDPLTLGRV